MNRQQSSRALIGEQPKEPFNHEITAVYLLVLGSWLTAIGAIMTGLAFAYETYPRVPERHFNSTTFVSVVSYFIHLVECMYYVICQQAMRYNMRCDVAGPILLSIGGSGLLASFILISVFGTCTTPAWLKKKKEQPTSSSGPEIPTIATSRF